MHLLPPAGHLRVCAAAWSAAPFTPVHLPQLSHLTKTLPARSARNPQKFSPDISCSYTYEDHISNNTSRPEGLHGYEFQDRYAFNLRLWFGF